VRWPAWLQPWFRKLSDPVIADRSVDLMAVVFWACYAGWGTVSTISGIPTIADTTTPLYELVWGGSIGILALVAFLAAYRTFFATTDVRHRIRRKVIELVSVSVLAGFISVYPMFLIGAVLSGDIGRAAAVFVAVSYLIFPTWRVRHLYKRIRQLRGLTGEAPT
jgi:hypothetical protein